MVNLPPHNSGTVENPALIAQFEVQDAHNSIDVDEEPNPKSIRVVTRATKNRDNIVGVVDGITVTVASMEDESSKTSSLEDFQPKKRG